MAYLINIANSNQLKLLFLRISNNMLNFFKLETYFLIRILTNPDNIDQPYCPHDFEGF